MSKELEALENIKHYDSRVGLHESDYDIIETALKKQEEDKKLLNEQAKSNRYLMEQIKQSQNKLKALEIIKTVCPYISFGKQTNIDNGKPYTLIIGGGYDCAAIELTKEEYDLLKEVLL